MGFAVDGTGNGDGLALTAGELADRSAQLRNADIQLIKDLACLTQHIRAIKHSNNAELTAHSLTTQEDVCTGIEIVAQGQILVDGFYPASSCLQLRREGYRFTI